MMIKKHRIPHDIRKRLHEAARYLDSDCRVVFAYLFGGLARGKPRPLSDVDLAIYLADTTNLADTKLDLIGQLTRILETDELDLVILNTAALPLRARVIEQNEILVDKNPFLRHRFESLTLREYFDFSVKEMQVLKRRYSLG